MNFKQLKNQIKEEQKQLASKITKVKSFRKPVNWVNIPEDIEKEFFWINDGKRYFGDWRIGNLSYTYRHKHIAYCKFFNQTPYELIERTTRDNHSPNKSLIEQYLKEWKKVLDEALYYS